MASPGSDSAAVEVELIDATGNSLGGVENHPSVEAAFASLRARWPGVSGDAVAEELAAAGGAFEWRVPLPEPGVVEDGTPCAALLRRRPSKERLAAAARESARRSDAVRAVAGAKDLVDLMVVLGGPGGECLPGEVWRCLPTFGGSRVCGPGVLSWDATHALEIDDGGRLRIRPRMKDTSEGGHHGEDGRTGA